ncbi:hypothetical protein Ddye_001714 [Dipteronia dyeriana]|uniref:Uncharacterized protein n=1 Tax=Dipteronia dyeriana TaxID=168575 RepID=A0AAD9XPS3_9ROSI|nr:hypothetical protein Ddye_001714 [Dipteronia dyeriana]
MTKEMGEFVGRLIGDLVDIDVGSTGECFGKYLRVLVAIDISKPLTRFLRLDLSKDGKESLLLLHYEKLPDYCFHCVWCHTYAGCALRRDGNIHGVDTEFDFGPWMHASSPLAIIRLRLATVLHEERLLYLD